MKKYFYLIPFLLFFFAPQAHAAISFDQASSWISDSSVSTLNVTTTVGTQPDEMLFAFVLTTLANPSATYNGIPMAPIITQEGPDSRWITLFALPSAPQGTYSLVFSSTSSNAVFQAGASSYFGVAQTTRFDAISSTLISTTVNNMTSTITTVTNNDWVILGARINGSAMTAGASSTQRSLSGSGSTGIYDTNSAVTPPETVSMGVNEATPGTAYSVQVAFAPFVPLLPTADVTISSGVTIRSGVTIK